MAFPDFTRTNPNLVTNGNFASSLSGWTTLFSPTPVWDGAVSRTADGSGSCKFPGKGGKIISSRIEVTEGTTYQLSAYGMGNGSQSESFFIFPHYYTSADLETSSASDPWANVYLRTESGIWEENPNTITVPVGRGITGLRIAIHRFSDEMPGASTLWVDDVYCGLAASYGQVAPTKVASEPMSHFRIDANGNMERWNGSAWEDFLIIGMYPDGSRSDWSVYSNKGYNVAYQTIFHAVIQKAWDVNMYTAYAMATFNVGFYCGPSPFYGLTRLNESLAEILSNASAEGTDIGKICTWFLDWELNETLEPLDIGFGTTDCPIRTTISTIKAWETTNNGGPTCPFSINTAYVASLRYFNSTGSELESAFHQAITYSNPEQQIDDIYNVQNLTMPCGPALFPNPQGTSYRRSVHEALMQGAKGYIFYADGDGTLGSFNDVTTAPWWSTVGTLNQEVVDLLPLIKLPPTTTWSVSTNQPSSSVFVRTRELAGVGYVWFCNRTASSKSVTCTVTGLGYTATDVVDYFTSSSVATPSSNVFTFTLDALNYTTGTKVLKLSGTPVSANAPTIDVGAGTFDAPLNTPTLLTGVDADDIDNDLVSLTLDGGANIVVDVTGFGGTVDI